MKLNVLNATLISIMLAGCASKIASRQRRRQIHPPLPPPRSRAAASSPATGNSTLAQQGRDPAEFPAYVEQLKPGARAGY